MADPVDMNQKLAQACTNMGAPPGSDKYYDCRMNLVQMISQNQLAQNRINASITPHNNGLYKLPSNNPNNVFQ